MSTSRSSKKEATYADLLALPENVTGEIVDGELIASPRPAAPHARASSILGGDLGPPFDRGRGGPGDWWIVDEPEVHLGRQVLVPDLAGWRRERMPAFPTDAFFTLAPDWVCEVLSPSTQRLDRVRKLAVYLEEGVTWASLVDPLARTLEVFESRGNRWTLAGAFEEAAAYRAVVEARLGRSRRAGARKEAPIAGESEERGRWDGGGRRSAAVGSAGSRGGEVVEDAADDAAFGDEGDHPHHALAAETDEGIDLVDPADELGPSTAKSG